MNAAPFRAQCLTVANPFDPVGSRSLRTLRRPRRIRSLAPRGPQPVIAFLNGRPVLRAEWRRRVRPGDQVMFVVLPQGGAGGGGSNPLRTILSLALLAFAPWAAGFIPGAVNALGGLTLFGKAITLGITLVGQALINAALPVPRPGVLPQASPTYTIGAQGNQARIEQAIPVHYGRLLAWPDFAAQPYTEFAGNEQYLYQLLCLGAGEFDIEAIRIEDTPIAAFAEIDSEIVPPGGQVRLFPTSVITSVEVSGQELTGQTAATYARAGTVITLTQTAHGRAVGQVLHLEFTTGGAPSDVYAIASVPTVDTFTVTAATGSGSGNAILREVVGGIDGFVASDAGTVAERLAVDVVLGLGLYSTDGGGELANQTLQFTVQARRVDDNGAPLAAWITLATETMTDRSVTPIARSFSYVLATPGRYRVRAWRLDAKSAASNAGHQISLAGLRSYLSTVQNFGAVTLIALRMRATNNLSAQASRRISVIATRKLPVWNGAVWSAPVATRSIAWAIADAARNGAYGAGLANARLDLAALLALDAVWAARGDTFNGRFDQAGTLWEAVSRIALAGRARPFMQGGKLRVVRDGVQSLPVALFSMRNIKRGSFGIEYIQQTEATADALQISYFDEATWSPRRVVAALAGSTLARPVKMEMFGVTDRAQALREGLYHAAANKYRRRLISFETEMEGFIPSIGDLIAVQHDMPGWGAQAEAVGWDAGSRTLRLSEPVSFGAGSHYVGLRTAGGGLSGPWAVVPGADAYSVILTVTPDMTPYAGSERERSHVVFGVLESWRTLALVTGIRPRGLYGVSIEAVAEDPSVHSAETGVTAPPIRTSSLPRRVTQPVVSRLFARRQPSDANRVVLGWRPAPGAETYQIEMAQGTDVADPNVSWTRTADTSAASQVITIFYPTQTLIRVRGVGLAAGPWIAATLGSLIGDFWLADAAAFWGADASIYWRA